MATPGGPGLKRRPKGNRYRFMSMKLSEEEFQRLEALAKESRMTKTSYLLWSGGIRGKAD